MNRKIALRRANELLESAEEFMIFASVPVGPPGPDGMVEAELVCLTPDEVTPEMIDSIKKFLNAPDRDVYRRLRDDVEFGSGEGPCKEIQ